MIFGYNELIFEFLRKVLIKFSLKNVFFFHFDHQNRLFFIRAMSVAIFKELHLEMKNFVSCFHITFLVLNEKNIKRKYISEFNYSPKKNFFSHFTIKIGYSL